MTTITYSSEGDEPIKLSLEAGHRIWITTSNVAQCREVPWHGDGPLSFTPEPDWPGDAFTVHLSDPRGGHLPDRADHANWLQAENARAVAEKNAARFANGRRASPTISLRAFGEGRTAPFRGFP